MSAGRETLSARVIAQVFVFVVVIPFLPLLTSRRWDWWEAWLYAFLTVALVIRTMLKDRTLLQRLEGYHDYAARMRYRPVPGVW